MREVERTELQVNPDATLRVSTALRDRSDLVVAQRRVCDGIELVRGTPTIGFGLERFTGMWGAAVTALAHELDLLGVELGKSAAEVDKVDHHAVMR